MVVSLTGETDAAADFYIPLAPPLSQKIFPHSFKISYANYTRTVSVERGTAPFQRQRSQEV